MQVSEGSDPLRLANEVNPAIPVAVAALLGQATSLNPAQRKEATFPFAGDERYTWLNDVQAVGIGSSTMKPSEVFVVAL